MNRRMTKKGIFCQYLTTYIASKSLNFTFSSRNYYLFIALRNFQYLLTGLVYYFNFQGSYHPKLQMQYRISCQLMQLLITVILQIVLIFNLSNLKQANEAKKLINFELKTYRLQTLSPNWSVHWLIKRILSRLHT